MATKYVDPALGFTSGINYCLVSGGGQLCCGAGASAWAMGQWLTASQSTGFGIPTELSAIAVLFTYWDPKTNHAGAYIASFLVLTVVSVAH